jgi:hypothetical protein
MTQRQIPHHEEGDCVSFVWFLRFSCSSDCLRFAGAIVCFFLGFVLFVLFFFFDFLESHVLQAQDGHDVQKNLPPLETGTAVRPHSKPDNCWQHQQYRHLSVPGATISVIKVVVTLVDRVLRIVI